MITMLFKSKKRAMRINSPVALEIHSACQIWLKQIDEIIKENLTTLTCDNIKEAYMALFGELKYWRSTSANFTGFSEFLVFRVLFHTIGEKFDKVETGDIAFNPVVFRSEHYEIAQSVNIPLIGGIKRAPDIYVKRNGTLCSIIQVKIGTYSGDSGLNTELKTIKLIRQKYPDIKSLFIVYDQDCFDERKSQNLKIVGYDILVMQDNNDIFSDILRKYI